MPESLPISVGVRVQVPESVADRSDTERSAEAVAVAVDDRVPDTDGVIVLVHELSALFVAVLLALTVVVDDRDGCSVPDGVSVGLNDSVAVVD